jgi:hypothetical protein
MNGTFRVVTTPSFEREFRELLTTPYPLLTRLYPHFSTAVTNPSLLAQLLQSLQLPQPAFESALAVRITT